MRFNFNHWYAKVHTLHLKSVKAIAKVAFDEGRKQAATECYCIANNISFQVDLPELMEMTKQGMSKRTCFEISRAIKEKFSLEEIGCGALLIGETKWKR